MFEGIEDSSDDESLNSYEGTGDDDEGRVEIEGKEVGRRGNADNEADRSKKDDDDGGGGDGGGGSGKGNIVV
jgi:SIT4-associating protein SAP185/190